ncbi:MAG TPA: hypothetical protein PLD57_07490 [Aggregatilineales bacterium]|nr:hypothetical protein [Aggregatilineales bacterium]
MLLRNKTFTMIWALLFALAVLLLPTAKAYAYLDPGTGSLIIQLCVGGVLSVGVLLKVFWTCIKGLFTGQTEAADATADQAILTTEESE